ncbi:MAG: GyrI-like domain-containing protein [Velocimicrobium sp.]
MNYEVVNLEEKKIIGLSARTNNAAPDMGQVIGELWQRFYTKGIYESIANKSNDKALGVYTNYVNDEKNDYTVLVACEVSEVETLPKGTVDAMIPAGKYAKFIVKGHMQRAVAEFWQRLWNMDLPRSFVSDFEEYQNGDVEDAEIHIYIGLK